MGRILFVRPDTASHCGSCADVGRGVLCALQAVSYTDGPEPHTVGRSRRQEKRGDARAGRSAAAAAAPQTVDSNGPKEDETREVIDLLD